MNVLVVSSRQDYWRALAPEFVSRSFALDCAPSMDEALDKIRQAPPFLVIFDADAANGGETEREYIRRIRKGLADILQINAMIHTVVVSPLSDGSFHDALEGFGVLLRFPPMPGRDDLDLLSGRLKELIF
jgi:DNA-binding response OmpR family regulator